MTTSRPASRPCPTRTAASSRRPSSPPSANVTAEAYERAAADRLGVLGGAGRAAGVGRAVGPRCWTGSRRSRSGSSAASSTSPSTASTGTSPPATATGSRIHWVGEPEDDTRTITYAELQRQVCQAANALDRARRAGRRPGLHLPADGPRGRRRDAGLRPHRRRALGRLRRLLARRRWSTGSPTPRPRSSSPPTAATGAARASALKPAVDEAAAALPVGHERARGQAHRARTSSGSRAATSGGTTSSSAQPETHEAEAFDAEQPLFLLYTSGTTGKPKGILHTSGGYLTQTAWTHWAVFDLKPETDVYWCTADVGWVTGHSYLAYGPLANGATQVMYEGTPDAGGRDRWWSIVEQYGVTILYTAPTAIRTFMKWGEDLPGGHDLSSLRVLGSVGEPINPEAWMWYRRVIGGDRCPIVDTWWQTETGAMMVAPLPGVTSTKPGSAMGPLPGISVDVVDGEGEVASARSAAASSPSSEPWPSMLRGIWGDEQRYRDTYWSRFEGQYFAGDGAKWDDEHVLWLLGRVDDVMNISGHRIRTTEVESALVSHPKVAEAAVVGAADPTTGQAIVAFVTVKGSVADDESAATRSLQELRNHVAKEIGAIAKPRQIVLTPELPKTRSGKIMRRLLVDIAEHRELGDVTTLADPTVVKRSTRRWAS